MIEVVSIPPLSTVQDLGREGHWFEGLGRAGAMDRVSHRIANAMLGNDPGDATLEIALTPASFRFGRRQAFALAGAACDARLDGRPLPRLFAGVAEEGQQLRLGPMTRGARLYLALPGGIDVPEVLGSRSTQLREGFGGLEGRALSHGDRLDARRSEVPVLPVDGLTLLSQELVLPGDGEIELRALPSAEHDEFSQASRAAFWSTAFEVSQQSNRQGVRLEGAVLERSSTRELRSHGIVPGIVQVPGGGQPIIQLADSATMGGYPKIATVIEPDHFRIAQARPGDRLRFREVGLPEAARAARELEDRLAALERDVAAFAGPQKGWA